MKNHLIALLTTVSVFQGIWLILLRWFILGFVSAWPGWLALIIQFALLYVCVRLSAKTMRIYSGTGKKKAILALTAIALPFFLGLGIGDYLLKVVWQIV
jgi:hypothetical protein